MLDIVYTTQFKKDYKLAKKRHVDIEELFRVIVMLQNQQVLPEEKKDHPLVGNYKGYRECHVRPDLLLIYKIKEKELELVLFRTGTHSDLY